MLAFGKPSHPSLMFAGKAGAYPKLLHASMYACRYVCLLYIGKCVHVCVRAYLEGFFPARRGIPFGVDDLDLVSRF